MASGRRNVRGGLVKIGPRVGSSALAVCVAVAVAGSIAACGSPRANASDAGTATIQTQTPATASGPAPRASLTPSASALSTAGLGTLCPLAEAGTGAQVTFAISLTDSAAACAAAGRALAGVVGGRWQEIAQEDYSLPLACAVIHEKGSVVVRGPAGGPRGAEACRELIAAGWVEDSSTEQLLRNLVLSTA
jgi:hypothetical protein